MADTSSCYFNRHTTRITEYGGSSTHPDSGKKILKLDLSNEEWDVLSNGEFFNRFIKSLIKGVSFVQIDGADTHQYLKFLTNILPPIRCHVPVRLFVDGCRTFFVEKMLPLVDGIGIDVRFPLRSEYAREDRENFKSSGEYRTPHQFRDEIMETAELAGFKELTVFRLCGSYNTEKTVVETREFLRNRKLPVIVGR